jgi:hypothetical protein
MCIIVVKPDNKRLDNWAWDALSLSFDNNEDGAGLMFREGNRLRIVKGLMSWAAFKRKVVELKLNRKAVVFHFRMATHGQRGPENTHPFPISTNVRDLRAVDVLADAGLVHNGVISPLAEDKLSDSQILVRDYLAPTWDGTLGEWGRRLLDMTACKYAVMTPVSIQLIGNFIKDKGWWFSNESYKYTFKPVPNFTWKAAVKSNHLSEEGEEWCDFCGWSPVPTMACEGDRVLCFNCADDFYQASELDAMTTQYKEV